MVTRSRKAAVYLRVSTDEQSTANQVPELQELADARGLLVVRTFEEIASATARRPALAELMDDARAGRFGVLLIWSVDRLDRSMFGCLERVRELARFGVSVISVRERWLDTDGPARELLLAVFGWMAQFERARLVERTNAGLARARAQGKRIGRPPVSPVMLRAAADRVTKGGVAIRRAAKAAGVPYGSLQRFLAGTGWTRPAGRRRRS